MHGYGPNKEGKIHPKVVEGGTAIYGDDGKIYVIYSGSGYWTKYYALGQITLNGDPLRESDWIKQSALILVMTVEPGFGGQSFMYDMMPKLRTLRQMLDEVNPSCLLEVDGGVDSRTAPICKENGAEVLVAGSAYFNAPERKAFIKLIEQ